MTTQTLWMNVYRAGHYHRQGKPECTNLHAGDFYTNEVDALAAAEPDRGYLDTVSFEMPVPAGTQVLQNPAGSEPTPLHVTRDNPLVLMPWHTAPEVFPIGLMAPTVCPLHSAPGGWESLESAYQ